MAYKSDDQIKCKLLPQLGWNTRLKQTEVGVKSSVDPEKVKFLIEDVLELRADREANRIMVKVENGEVTLTGVLTSWNEKKAILGAVSHMSGVTEIDDHLIIDPYGIEFLVARG